MNPLKDKMPLDTSASFDFDPANYSWASKIRHLSRFSWIALLLFSSPNLSPSAVWDQRYSQIVIPNGCYDANRGGWDGMPTSRGNCQS